MGGNKPSIEPSHGRFIACHKINFHIKPEKRGSTYTRVLHLFLQFGVKIWGVDLYVQLTCMRLYMVCLWFLVEVSSVVSHAKQICL